MSALSCPFKQVSRKATVDAPHTHQFLVETSLDDPSIVVRDCACGARQRVRLVAGSVVEEFGDAVHVGGSSLMNCIFARKEEGGFTDRWATQQQGITN